MPGVKGKTNNPNGRPLGALNALAKRNFITVNELLEDNLDKVREEFAKLNGLPFVRLYVDLLKQVTPSAPPVVAEEEESVSDLEDRVMEAANR
jgi:ribosome-interacting GTPase 1